MDGSRFLVFLDLYGLKVFGFEDLTAIQALDVFDAVAPGNHLGTGMVASGLHKQRLDEVYFIRLRELVKPPGGRNSSVRGLVLPGLFSRLGPPCRAVQFVSVTAFRR